MANRGKKNAANESKADPNAWMVTFGDLLMLMLTFFVMLLTMKSMDTGTIKEVFDKFAAEGPLNFYSSGIKGDSEEEAVSGIQKPETILSKNMLEETMVLIGSIEGHPPKGSPMEALKNVIEIAEDHSSVIVSLEADHLFASGQAEIRPEKRAILEELGRLLRTVANDIWIMGHTDDLPVHGPRFASNWELSLYRALSVFDYLIKESGLNPSRIAVGGYGESMPRFSNTTSENRAKNRRVEFIIQKPYS